MDRTDRPASSIFTDEAYLFEGLGTTCLPTDLRELKVRMLWYVDSRGYVETRGIPYDWERFGL